MGHTIGDTRFSLPALLKIGPHSEEGSRVTMFELFFDLVFVFSFTQVSRLMAEGHDALGVLRGMVVLGMLWGLWASFGWLSNQARADRGLVRTGLIFASILIFLLAVTIPRAFPEEGESPALALVLVGCYFACRIIHGILYFKAAGDDVDLRRQVIRTSFLPIPLGLAIFVTGAIVGAPWQTWIWVAAFVIDSVVIYRTSSERPGQTSGWRVHSASYWVERFALIVILGLGESVVALGVGAVRAEVSLALVGAIALTVVLAQPGDGVEEQVLDAHHRHGAGHVAAAVAADPVGHHQQMPQRVAQQGLGLRDARLAHVKHAAHIRDDELILVGGPRLPLIGQPVGRQRQPRRGHFDGSRCVA